jgi:hypothetical protein
MQFESREGVRDYNGRPLLRGTDPARYLAIVSVHEFRQVIHFALYVSFARERAFPSSGLGKERLKALEATHGDPHAASEESSNESSTSAALFRRR